MKTAVIALLAATLGGCATTANLATSGTLSSGDQKIVQSLSERAKEVCVTYSYREGPLNSPVSGNMAAHDLPEVRRFFRSSSTWVKATIIINGVWGNIYFDSSTRRIACSDDGWLRFNESRSLNFEEVPANASP